MLINSKYGFIALLIMLGSGLFIIFWPDKKKVDK